MLRNFFSTHRIVITPLSPVHIGTGEDFEPTNYVIDVARHLLYGINPAQAVLTPEELRQLRNAVNSGTLSAINKFYSDHLESYRTCADCIVPISDTGLSYHRKMLAPKGKEKMTQFIIARTSYDRRHGIAAPYVPGSSIKGTIATALMNRLNARKPSLAESAKSPAKFEQTLFGGSFERSPMRFIKVGDCHSGEATPLTNIFSSRRFFKADGSGDGVKACFEAIVPGQYRCFEGEMTLAGGMNVCDNPVPHVYTTAEALLKDLHTYSLENWYTEFSLYRNDAAPWAQSVKKLLEALSPQIRAGHIALVRLGKNAGAENKTLHGESVPQIQIRHKDKSSELLDHSTTLWLTDESPKKVNDKDISNGLPYGWALLELDPTEENKFLKSWCTQECRRSGFDQTSLSIVDEWKVIRALRLEAEKKQRALIEAQQLRDERRRKEQEEEQSRAEHLASLSPEARAIEEFCQALEKVPGAVKPGTDLFNKTRAFLTEATAWPNSTDKMNLAKRIAPILKAKQMYQGKAEKEFKGNLRKLRGEA